MSKGKKHYSGKELLYHRRLAKQQAKNKDGGPVTRKLQQINKLSVKVKKDKQLREVKKSC